METIEISTVATVLVVCLVFIHLRKMHKRARDKREDKLNRLRWG